MAVELEHQCFGLLLIVIASLLSQTQSAQLVLQEDAGVETKQVTKESYKSEDVFKNDEVDMPATAQQQGHEIHSRADKAAGNEKVKEPYEQDLGQSELEDKITSSSYEGCEAEHPLRCEEEEVKYLGKHATLEKQGVENVEPVSEQVKDAEFSGNIIQRSMQGLEVMLGQVEKSGVKVFEKLGGVMDQVGLSREHMLKHLDTVMDQVSESKVRVIQSLDSLMDQVSASKTKMMEEIDHVIDKVTHSKVIVEIREIRESVVLSVRDRSYVAAGVMVAITTAILVAGAVYFAWCHQDTWTYPGVPLESQSGYKDQDDGNSTDTDDLNSTDADDDNSTGTDDDNSKASVKYEADVERHASAPDLKNISNGHTSALGDDEPPEDDDEKGPDDDSSQMVTSFLGIKDSDGKGNVNDEDVQNVPGKNCDVSLQLPLVSSCSEVLKPGVEVTQDVGDLHAGHSLEIPKEDVLLKCQQKSPSSQDEHQNNMPSLEEHGKGMPSTNEHRQDVLSRDEHQSSMSNTNSLQADSGFESLLSKDKSYTLASMDVTFGCESNRGASVGRVKPKDHQRSGFSVLGSGEAVEDAQSFSVLGSDDAVEDAQSDTAPLIISYSDSMRNIDPVAKVTVSSLEKEDNKKECLQSSVGAVKAESYGTGEGVI